MRGIGMDACRHLAGAAWRRVAGILPATWAAFALFSFTMFYKLAHSPLWGDEWNEWAFSQAPFAGGKFYRAVAGTFQPPLYNVLAHFWLKVSQTPLWFRLLNIPLGWFAAIVLYRTLARWKGRSAGAAAVAGLAVCNQWVECIQECSEYALMLVFLFLALRGFLSVWEAFSWRALSLFLAGCTGAVGSQYGAVFVVVPCAVALWGREAARSGASGRRFLAVSGLFLACAVAFGLPLWFWFLRIQMAHNRIAGNVVALSWRQFLDFPYVFGEIFAWLFAVERGRIPWMAWAVPCAMPLLALAISAFRFRDGPWRALAGCLACSYVLHFLLVRFQIYAMVRPGLSGGFLCRYSYFYIPVLALWVPAAVTDAMRALRRKGRIRAVCFAAVLAVAALPLVVDSCVHVCRNRHKAWDDLFADIWFENRGWENPTFLSGVSKQGFLHYVGRKMSIRDIPRGTVCCRIKEHLPEAFWIWHSNWNPSAANQTVEKARSLGYEVPVECRRGDHLLVFCRLPSSAPAPQGEKTVPVGTEAP